MNPYLIALTPTEAEVLRWRTERTHKPVGSPHCTAAHPRLGAYCYRQTHTVQGKTRRYLRHNARRST